MAEIAEPKQLSLFSRNLPRRPYCSDDLGFGTKIRSAKDALKRRYIQYNPPSMVWWLVYDIDRPYNISDWDWRLLPPPNIVVINPVTKHAHYLYGIAAGVSTTKVSREGPRRLLCAIDEGYRHALDADPGFTRRICKNPFHSHWTVETLRQDLYNLNELAEYVDLDAADKRIKRTPKKHRMGIGRNCSLFDSLRTWAYKWITEYRGAGLERWCEVVLAKAENLNTFVDPLPFSEVKATARSVAKWTFNHYSGKLGPGSLAEAGLTPETFSLVQSNLGRMGNAKRWGDNGEKRVLAKSMKDAGATQVEIAQYLEVNQATVSRWLKG